MKVTKILDKIITTINSLQDLCKNIELIIYLAKEIHQKNKDINKLRPKDIKIDNPYIILGVSPDDSIKLIKKIYKLKAKEYHPDVGGDNEKFIMLDRAYKEILSRKRREK